MILICHPRSGSHWVSSCIQAQQHNVIELFGFSRNNYPLVTVDEKIKLIQTGVFNDEIISIHPDDFTKPHVHSAYGHPSFIDFLSKRNDVYLLKRRNIRAAIISLKLAWHHHSPKFHGFHNTHGQLTSPCDITFTEVFDYYRMMHTEFSWIEKCLSFREKFIYEDLVSGLQTPTTVNWAPETTRFSKIGSIENLNLVRNLDEVEKWMDMLNIPGSLHYDISR